MTHPQIWQPDQYNKNAGFVSKLGQPVLELLNPQPGEHILDLGCGEGTLLEKIANLGCHAVGVDSSPAQIEAARARGLDAQVMAGQELDFEARFDAVFSNAALHWMKPPEAVVSGVWRALKPGGRFVAEFGGSGNVETVRRALHDALTRRGIDAAALDPWYFPTTETYRRLLTTHGFNVTSIKLIPRPTPLPGDITGWFETFVEIFTHALSPAERPAFIAEVRETIRPSLCDAAGQWTVDYVRLRFAAAKPGLVARRMGNVQKSFIREILKVTEKPEVISFAGGLPNPRFFPAAQLAAATQKVLTTDGQNALQYSTTEGYPPLRQMIAERYRQQGLTVSADDILIVNGSQQALDLIGKLLINPGDGVVIERPGYLGAIQALSLYEPTFHGVSLQSDGLDAAALTRTLDAVPVKLVYTAPNFQNPSGITYSLATRQAVAKAVRNRNLLLVEDNPYGELRFVSEPLPSLRHFLGEQVILMGSFSKVVAPALRLGWLVASPALMPQFITAKQAADLHSNYLAQRILHQYLLDNDLEAHLATIRAAYKKQRDLMIAMLEELLPPEVNFTRPNGGMFVWVTLPEAISAMELLETASRQNVAFVPGRPFYVDGGGDNTLRLNFSNPSEADIETGLKRLAAAIRQAIGTNTENRMKLDDCNNRV